MIRHRFLSAACLLAIALPSGLAAQAPAEPAVAPVTLTLRLAEGRTQFRPGEVIPIELEFSSSIKGRFVVDGATYDRSGRLLLEQFRIDPLEGVTDPLLDFFAARGGGVIGGGIRTMWPLGEKSATVRLELNEWFRFDRPGAYTLSLRSARLTDETRRTAMDASVVPVESNTVSFEILPRDGTWEAEVVRQAVATLDGAGPDADRRTACRMQRFLATEAAADEMIRRLDDREGGCGFDYTAGLFGAPNREHVVKRLEERLTAPDQPVGSGYLRTLAALSLYLRNPDLRPRQTRDTIGRFVAGELSRRRDLVEATMEHYKTVLMAALPGKTAPARALSLAELLGMATSARGASADPLLRGQVAAAFLDLPAARQRTLLEYEWTRFRDPDMLPALRRLVASQPGADPAIFDLALRRLYELAPEEGRLLILRELRNPRSAATALTLTLLPDRELAELDDVLIERIETGGTLERDAELLERYASPSPAPRLLASVGDRMIRMACRPQAALLAYVLRVDPEAGRTLLERVLAARADTGCYRMALSAVAKYRMTPLIEALAIAHLDDPDPEVVRSAADALGHAGSAAAMRPLRARFERWRQTWAGRQEELRFSYAQERRYVPEAGVEHALAQALARGSGWLMDEEAVAGLRADCVTDSCRQQVDQMAGAAGGRRIQIRSVDEPRNSSISIAQYEVRSLDALEQKLAQYSRGTSFTLEVRGLDSQSAASVIARLTASVELRGLKITIPDVR